MDGLGGLAADDAVVDLAVAHRDAVGLVAAGETGAGKDDGFQEVGTGAGSGNLGEIGTDAPALRLDGVAGGADRLIAEEDLAAALVVAFRQKRSQLVESGRLLFRVRRQLLP